MLVIDILLLMSMLIGLLPYAHRSSIGICSLLYQQVVPFPLQYPMWDADIPQVYHLDSVSGHCRGATCRQSVSASLSHRSNVSLLQVFIILNLNGVYLSTHVGECG